MFEYRYTRYLWNGAKNKFEPIVFDVAKPFSKLLEYADKSQDEHWRRYCREMLYGPGEIIVPSANIFMCFLDEFMDPFYMFTIYSLGIWYWEAYTTFAIVLTVLAGVSIISSVFNTYMATRRVKHLAKYTCPVQMLQEDGSFKEVNSAELVPGDVIRIPT
jgi:cation-transporting P-type ATPase 13A2